MDDARPRVAPAILIGGLAIAYLPMYAGPLGRWIGLDISHWGPAATLVWNWLAVALLAGYVWRVERLGPDSLRLVRPSEKDLEWGGYLGGAAVLWHWLSSRLLPASATESEAVGGQETLVALGPLLAFALVVTTASPPSPRRSCGGGMRWSGPQPGSAQSSRA